MLYWLYWLAYLGEYVTVKSMSVLCMEACGISDSVHMQAKRAAVEKLREQAAQETDVIKKKQLQQAIDSEDKKLQDVEADATQAESEERAQIEAREKELDRIKEEEHKLAELKQKELQEAEERLKKQRQEVQDMLAQAAKVR